MSIFNLFKKQDLDLEFLDCTPDSSVYSHNPPILAKDLKPLKEYQEKTSSSYNFPGCPGMHDYARMGYIIPAWTNVHIKTNKAGSVVMLGNKEEPEKRKTNIAQPKNMSTDITHGLFELQGGIQPCVWNLPGAWKVHGYGNVSILLLPAYFHSNFLDDIYVYPGVVDYNGFSTLNFIFSPKRPCEIEIKEGEPLLHIIPFITNKTIVANYGPPVDREKKDRTSILKWFSESNFYRKYYMIKKKYTLTKKTS